MSTRLGTVTRTSPAGIYVELADVAPGYEFGPCLDTVGGLVKGDRVVTQALASDRDTLVVTGLIGGRDTGVVDLEPYVTDEDLTTALVPYAEDVDLTALGDALADALDLKVDTSDPRLTDARTPTAHNHDDRYYTETEADARYPAKVTLAAVGSATWVRVASVNGGSAGGGASITLLVAGQGLYTQATRVTDLVHFGQRGDNAYSWEAWRFGSNTAPWQYLVKQVSTYVFELWARRNAFDPLPQVQQLAAHNGTLLLDSATTTLPAGLTALETPTPVMPTATLLESIATTGSSFAVPNDSTERRPTNLAAVAFTARGPSAVYRLSYSLDGQTQTANGFLVSRFYVDGVAVQVPSGVLQNPGGTMRAPIAKTLRLTGLTAGSHSVEVRVTTQSTGTATVYDHSNLSVELVS